MLKKVKKAISTKYKGKSSFYSSQLLSQSNAEIQKVAKQLSRLVEKRSKQYLTKVERQFK